MRTMAVLAMVAAILVGGPPARAQETLTMPVPRPEHEWLNQFAGEWETEAEMVMGPGQPPQKWKGSESTRMLGGFWLVSEMKGDCMGTPMTALMTVGYDPQKRKYVGTFVSSVDGHLWKYEGTAEGRVLTLETEGPNLAAPGTTCKMRDVVELKDENCKVLTSSMLGEDGKWVTFATMTGRRKK